MIQGQYRQVNDPNFLTKIIKTSRETLIFVIIVISFILKLQFDLYLL